MRRKILDAFRQQCDQARQMRKMAGDHDVARFRSQSIANPLRPIVRLKVVGG